MAEQQSGGGGYKESVKILGVVMGLGVELAVVIAAMAMLGGWMREQWGLGVWVVLVMVALGGVAIVLHIRYVLGAAKRRSGE